MAKEESIMKSALVYVRYASKQAYYRSFNDPSQLSIQNTACRTFAEENGFTIMDSIVEYGVSGRTTERESIRLLLNMLAAKHIDALIMASFDRISRNTLETFSLLDLVAEHGVEIWSVKEGNYAEFRENYVKHLQAVLLAYIEEGKQNAT